jgi:hypothetical protein
MANKVINSSPINTVMSGGRFIIVKYATETDSWKRHNLATDTQNEFAKAIEKADVPVGATTAIMT